MNTWATGLNPTYKKFDDWQTELFLISITDAHRITDKVNDEFLIKILDKRIEVMNLPIKFSQAGKVAALCFADRAGAMVMLLIDCLNAYEGKEVTPQMLADLYPEGFYDEDTMMRYADGYLKHPNRRVKWAEVY